MKSIIILCGGRSTRMGKDKGSLLFKGKPMIIHTLNVVKEVADEIIVVLRDPEQVNEYSEMLKSENNILIVTDLSKDQGPLIGILTGLLNINSEYAQVLPCDSPCITKEFILNMFNAIEDTNFEAVIPIWEDGHIEPLHSIYTKSSLKTIEKLIKNGKRDVSSIINNLNVKLIDINEVDKTKMSFKNINTIKDINSLNNNII